MRVWRRRDETGRVGKKFLWRGPCYRERETICLRRRGVTYTVSTHSSPRALPPSSTPSLRPPSPVTSHTPSPTLRLPPPHLFSPPCLSATGHQLWQTATHTHSSFSLIRPYREHLSRSDSAVFLCLGLSVQRTCVMGTFLRVLSRSLTAIARARPLHECSKMHSKPWHTPPPSHYPETADTPTQLQCSCMPPTVTSDGQGFIEKLTLILITQSIFISGWYQKQWLQCLKSLFLYRKH